MTGLQLMAFNLIFYMLETILINMGYKKDEGLIEIFDKKYDEIIEKMIDNE